MYVSKSVVTKKIYFFQLPLIHIKIRDDQGSKYIFSYTNELNIKRNVRALKLNVMLRKFCALC